MIGDHPTGQNQDAATHRGVDAHDLSDWAFEFLRRNPAYRRDWRDSVPRRLPVVTLSDGTHLLRLRRRYPRAEQWGLYAFADPARSARQMPVFWLAGAHSRLVKARAVNPPEQATGPQAPLVNLLRTFEHVRVA
jgi:hypothetical protein